ncbi:MAG TPA: hypothetical protein VNG51_01305 [Ktedonobacteraceae bacterium]|nr:hypothetical protein [Ktedonobacteraceae bacterium]
MSLRDTYAPAGSGDHRDHAPDCRCVICDHYRYTEPVLWHLPHPIEGIQYGVQDLQLDRLRVLSLEAPHDSHN